MLPFDVFWSGQDLPEEGLAVEFPNDRDPADLAPWLERLALVRVAFPAMGDGRGFSIARQLRAMGYAGRLRAAGPLVADQFRVGRRVGFDEVELPDAVADAPAGGAVAPPPPQLLPGPPDLLIRSPARSPPRGTDRDADRGVSARGQIGKLLILFIQLRCVNSVKDATRKAGEARGSCPWTWCS